MRLHMYINDIGLMVNRTKPSPKFKYRPIIAYMFANVPRFHWNVEAIAIIQLHQTTLDDKTMTCDEIGITLTGQLQGHAHLQFSILRYHKFST